MTTFFLLKRSTKVIEYFKKPKYFVKTIYVRFQTKASNIENLIWPVNE